MRKKEEGEILHGGGPQQSNKKVTGGTKRKEAKSACGKRGKSTMPGTQKDEQERRVLNWGKEDPLQRKKRSTLSGRELGGVRGVGRCRGEGGGSKKNRIVDACEQKRRQVSNMVKGER